MRMNQPLFHMFNSLLIFSLACLVCGAPQGCRSSFQAICGAASFRQLSTTLAANLRASSFARTVTAGVTAAWTSHSVTVLALTWPLWKTTCCASETPGGWPTRSLRNLVSQKFLQNGTWKCQLEKCFHEKKRKRKHTGGTVAFKILLKSTCFGTTVIFFPQEQNTLKFSLRTKTKVLFYVQNPFLAVKLWQLPDFKSRDLSVIVSNQMTALMLSSCSGLLLVLFLLNPSVLIKVLWT